jgi:hypothetical protein
MSYLFHLFKSFNPRKLKQKLVLKFFEVEIIIEIF